MASNLQPEGGFWTKFLDRQVCIQALLFDQELPWYKQNYVRYPKHPMAPQRQRPFHSNEMLCASISVPDAKMLPEIRRILHKHFIFDVRIDKLDVALEGEPPLEHLYRLSIPAHDLPDFEKARADFLRDSRGQER